MRQVCKKMLVGNAPVVRTAKQVVVMVKMWAGANGPNVPQRAEMPG